MEYQKVQRCQHGMRIACLCMVSIAACRHASLADDTKHQPIVTGKQLKEVLVQRRSVSYDNGALRKSLADLQASTGICIVRDRRIDPSTSVTLTTPYLTNAQVISSIAQHVSATASFGDHFVLVGPEGSTAKLQTLIALNKKAVQGLRRRLDSTTYRKLVESKDYAWERLARPRDLLTTAAADIGLTINNPGRIPHDLFDEVRLPSTTFCEFASLLLLQYDLSFEINEEGVLNIVDVADAVAVEKKYRLPSQKKAAVFKRWSAAFPGLSIDHRGTYATIATTVENHLTLQRLMTGDQPGPVAAAGLRERLFTFKVPPGTKLGLVVESLKASGVSVRFQDGTLQQIETYLQQVVTIDVTDKVGTEFFEELFKGTGVTVLVSDAEVVLKF